MRELERDIVHTPTERAPIVIVGRGRVGASLATAFGQAGLPVRLTSTAAAAERSAGATAVLLCVPDAEIASTAAALAPRPPKLVGHVSGAGALAALDSTTRAGAGAFSIHPLQTFADGSTPVAGIPCAIAGSDEAAESFADALARDVGMRPFAVPDERRAAYHAAASIASNFLVALKESAAGLLEAAGVEDGRELLAPLVLRTAANWAEHGVGALTGPIARGDAETVERHRAALAELAPELLPIYEALAARTAALARSSPSGGDSAALALASQSAAPGRRRTDTAPAESKGGGGGMRIVHTKRGLREALAGPRREGKRIGLVPTMGAFHEGHLSLMRAARAGCDLVVVSLFVNPSQFGPGEDLATYPRDESRDTELAEREGVDLLWIPSVDEMYPDGFGTAVEVDEALTGILDGAADQRGPEHFRGVTTVVAKLFNCVQPDAAFFGRKDAQQAVVIERMARDLDFPVEVIALPTVRDPDGLAMSSRNVYLDESDRESALALSRALRAAERAAANGERSADVIVSTAINELRSAGVNPEYVEARDARDLSPVADLNGRPVLLAVAARVGRARLIDNVVITNQADSPEQMEAF
jgi:pantoate--beta-alanine ligase